MQCLAMATMMLTVILRGTRLHNEKHRFSIRSMIIKKEFVFNVYDPISLLRMTF